MTRPAPRWTVLALAITVAAGCCYRAAVLERHALEQRRALATAAADARALQGALSDARRAIAAMASPGQAAVSWSRQATASIDTARGRLMALASTEGGAQLRPLAERFDRLTEAEARLHDSAVGGRALMASDVAFGEALPHVDAIDQRVAETLAAMMTAADRSIAAARDQQILAFSGALGALGIAAVLLTPLPRKDADVAPATADDPGTTPAGDLSLHAVAAPAAGGAMAPGTEARVIEKARVDLTPLAAACGALARVSDGATLPGVLDAVRPTLGARGLAVWLVDGAGERLQVVASSGYDPRLVERFPALRVSDDTPTSQAFARVAPVRTPPRATQPAAVAVPIEGASGATGVLSFEMANGRDTSADVVAAATIVAAQLATLLEPARADSAPPAAAEA